jgi:hypothetical protein
MKLRLILPLLVTGILAFGPSNGCAVRAQYDGCCKVCTVGKACGDTCIAAWKTCYVGPGCACDAIASVR